MDLKAGDLMPCDILLIKGEGRGFIPETICDIQNSIYSHSAIIVKNETIIEAGWFNVKFNNLDYYKGRIDIYRCLELNNLLREKIIYYLIKQLGKRYDYKMLIWEFIRLKLNIILPYFNTNSVICSELISDGFRSINIDLTPNIKYPSPSDLSNSSLCMIGSI